MYMLHKRRREMNRNELEACRAFNRALTGTKTEFIGRMQFEAADRMFDGGEWSEGMQADAHQARFDRMCAQVASRYNLTPGQLEWHFYDWGNETSERTMRAICGGNK